MVCIEDPELIEKLRELAAVHTAGDVAAMHRLLLVQVLFPQVFEAVLEAQG